MIIVHTLHVIPEVPLARESIARLGAFATRIGAAERLLPMSVPSMGFPLMSEETGRRRKSGAIASGHLARIRLQVRVHKLAVIDC